MSDFTILHTDELERSGNWLLARRSLGLGSFGMNIVDSEPGEQIPEHDETERDQEEVFVLLSGEASMVIDGHPHELTAGSLCRLGPEPSRTVVAKGAAPAPRAIGSAPTPGGS